MNDILSYTKSVCPVCLQVLEAARIVADDGNIYLVKTCPDHGTFKTLIWEGSPSSYLAWGQADGGGDCVVAPVPVRNGCPYDCGLCSNHRTNGCCVLLELTKRCNLACPVCFANASAQAAAADMTLAEIGAQYDLLMERGGPFNIQLSGGEPTLRHDLPEIIRLGREKGFTFFQLNTNGLRLAEEQEYAAQLKAAGLNCVFLQFDGFAEAVYETLRGRSLLKTKLQAIENCATAALGVVLVPVIAPKVNMKEIGKLLRFAIAHMPTVRGVHFQPVSYFGRCALVPGTWRITIPRMLAEIEKQTDGLMRRADFGGGGAENPYCSFHASYLRLADGRLQALPRRRSQSCCVKASEARDFVARQWAGGEGGCIAKDTGCANHAGPGDMMETSSLDAFLQQAREKTFTVSAMFFQDAYTLDFDRLQRCYICEVDNQRGMIPFCAYNLTDREGKALYRK